MDYRFFRRQTGWEISQGDAKYWVASGPDYSLDVGMQLFRALENGTITGPLSAYGRMPGGNSQEPDWEMARAHPDFAEWAQAMDVVFGRPR